MKKVILLSVLLASSTAIAGPCPAGNNSHLGDTTSSSAQDDQQAKLDALAASSSNAGTSRQAHLSNQGFRTAFPH
jgi:hypothetical protein